MRCGLLCVVSSDRRQEFFRSAAQLLAHPFQRPASDDELIPQRSELVTSGEAVSAKSAAEGEGATSADARVPGD